MQVNLLKTIVSSVVGQSAASIVDVLYGKKNVNEFLISKKLKLTINQTRNVLYKLADEGIVSFIRKKDRKKGGWYTYFWTLNSGKGLIKLKEHLSRELETKRTQLNSKKTEKFFFCPNCDIQSNEETALLHQYTCPECGEVLQLKDKAKEVETLEKEIAKLEEIFASVNVELESVNKQDTQTNMRKLRAEAKKKAKERAIKKKKKDAELKKLKKSSGSKKKKVAAKKSFGKTLGKKLSMFLRR